MADRDPEQERIRGYLQAQAAKHPIPELRLRVQEGVDALHASALRFDETTFTSTPPNDTWTPRECLEHSVGSNLSVSRQILYVALTGELPAEEEITLPQDRDGMLARHTEGIDSLYAHLEEANPEAFLDVKWDHPFFGDLNWREWFLFLRIHCYDHQRQLDSMLAGPA